MRYRRYALLGSVLLISLLLLTLQLPGHEGWEPGEVLSWVTSPTQALIARIHKSAVSLWTTYRGWRDLQAENLALRDEVEKLRLEALQAAEIVEENARLRRILVLKERLPLETLPGEVIGKDGGGWVRSLTVNRGRGDGITRLTPVIAADGLVGRVVAVRARGAVVQLINDPSSTVGAMVQRTRVQGVVEGEPGGNLRFRYLVREGRGVETGDVVVTSGLGGLFPKGLPVGRVMRVEERNAGLFQYASLSAAVDFARVEEVLFLVERSILDLGPIFPSS